MAGQFLASHFLSPRQLPKLLRGGRRIHLTKLAALVQQLLNTINAPTNCGVT